jgi:alginate O-acetyltransferase complex protein AlgI
VMFAWVFFRAETLSSALGWLAALAGLNDAPAAEIYIGKYFDFSVLLALLIGVVGASPVKNVLPGVFRNMAGLWMFSRYAWVMCIFMLSIAYMAAGTFNPFIYFRF